MQRLAHLNQNEETTKPPLADSFEIETDLERRRVFLRYVNRAWLIFGLVTLTTLPIFPEHRVEFIFLIAVIFPSYLIIRFLNLSGRTRLAGVVITLAVNFGFYGLFMVLVGELGAYKAFETETTVWMLMGLAVLFAGTFVDKWAAPGLALINTVLLIGTRLIIAPDSTPRPSALVFWWMMALTIWLYERTLGRALERVLAELIERRQAEESVREAESKYRNLVERLPQVIYTSELGANGVWAYVSPKIEELLGYTPQEWLADPTLWYRQVHPDDRDKQLALENEAYARNEPFESEYRILTRAGNWIWVRDSGHILPSQSGGQPIVQGLLVDITERKRVEEDLSLSKTQLLANLEHTPNVAVQWYDKDGHILYWNPASEKMYGWEAIDAIGKTLDQLIHTPEEQAEFMRILAEVQETGKPFGPYEAQVRRLDGTPGWVLATTFSIPMNDRQIGFVCMDVDITERKQAEEKIQQQLQRLNALHSIDMAINSSMDMQITLEVLLNQVTSQLNVDAADVLVFNQPAQTLEYAAGRGFHSNINTQLQQRLSESLAGRAISERRMIHISNMMEAGKNLRQILLLANDAFHEYFAVPLIAKGQVKGVLEVFHRSVMEPESDWVNFLEVIAGQAAIAVDNAQLVQGLQRSNMELIFAYNATIEGWSQAMDLRDKETEGHTQRVTNMTLKLARTIGIREADIVHIQRGGLLHDIGKLGVPDNILLKPGELTPAEWEIMRQHPTFAFNMLAHIPYLKQSLDIPYCHHEKWDGNGYPQGLKGEQIPLSARIFAIADVWDALTNDRPYRKAWKKEKTIEFIKEQSGSHFDPQIVDVFLKMISDEL